MINVTTDIFYDRQSVKSFDADFELSKEQIADLIDKANRAPSAWNLQHWKYLVVHSKEAKEQLLPLAFYQSQIKESSATIIILADREAHTNNDLIFNRDIAEGRMTEAIKEQLDKQIESAYQTPEYRFESALVNSSLAAMQLINAATLAGLGSCPIGGFNRTALMETFHIEERYLPTMLITIGKTAKKPRESARLSVEETATFI